MPFLVRKYLNLDCYSRQFLFVYWVCTWDLETYFHFPDRNTTLFLCLHNLTIFIINSSNQLINTLELLQIHLLLIEFPVNLVVTNDQTVCSLSANYFNRKSRNVKVFNIFSQITRAVSKIRNQLKGELPLVLYKFEVLKISAAKRICPNPEL